MYIKSQNTVHWTRRTLVGGQAGSSSNKSLFMFDFYRKIWTGLHCQNISLLRVSFCKMLNNFRRLEHPEFIFVCDLLWLTRQCYMGQLRHLNIARHCYDQTHMGNVIRHLGFLFLLKSPLFTIHWVHNKLIFFFVPECFFSLEENQKCFSKTYYIIRWFIANLQL